MKLVDELLVHLMVYPKWKQQVSRSRGITSMLDIDPKLFATYKKIIEEYYEPTWSWFHLVMDRLVLLVEIRNVLKYSSIFL